jgi:hypothetical protein
MAYAYSHPVDPSILASRGCFTILPVRKSDYESMAVATSYKVFEEYNRLVGKAEITGGVYDPRGHAISLTFPECSPTTPSPDEPRNQRPTILLTASKIL